MPKQNRQRALTDYNLARQQQRLGKFQCAIKYLKSALQHYPQFAEAHITLAAIQIDLCQWQMAAVSCQRALALALQNPAVHNNLCIIHQHTGKLTRAIEHGQKAQKLNPNSITIWVNLAAAHRAANQLAAAKQCSQKLSLILRLIYRCNKLYNNVMFSLVVI